MKNENKHFYLLNAWCLICMKLQALIPSSQREQLSSPWCQKRARDSSIEGKDAPQGLAGLPLCST